MIFQTYLRPVGLLLCLGLSFACGEETDDTLYDLVIRNGWVHDGTGAPPYYGQLLINGEKIAKIDRDTARMYRATKVIDANGKVVSPGFIDSHAHGDPLKTPEFKNFLAMGVTTIFLGQDGSSPNTPAIRPWMDTVDRLHPGVNIGMSVGHGTLRMISGVAYDRQPTEEGLSRMESLLADALEEGCFGLSTGLEYNPGYLAGEVELRRLAQVVGKKGGMIMSHVRNEDDDQIESSLQELLAQGEYCPVHVSHIKIVYAKGSDRARDILSILNRARAAGMKVSADLYPYEASYTGIGLLFPEWAKPPATYETVVRERKSELEEHLRNRVNARNGPEATLLGSGPYKGKTLAEVAEELRKPFERVLVEDIGPSGASAAYFVMDETVMKEFLKDDYVNVCSDGSPTSNHPRGHGTFAKIIEAYVVKDTLLSLPQAIHKMTALAASNLGIRDRGQIKVGYFADLLVFDPTKVKANASYEEAAQLASGFDWVVINGRVAKEAEEFTSPGQGRILRKSVPTEK
ncbi:amidohydrolase family protein [Cyclobacterium xiamenense]|uniref:N-acyl-D-amino-acid deacylase family protein n=1 Tax=Cyclobacterium xiamenense TaxID=1297121 RepID=UPI0035CF9098